MSSNPEKRKGVYWLTIEPEELHKEKASILATQGYDVTFFQTLDALLKEIRSRRVNYIILGDEGPEVVVLKAIAILNRMPEIQGARLILSSSRNSPTVLRAAACEAFRDILPISLNSPEWLDRFIFSTSGRDATLTSPSTQLSCLSNASLSIPARIVWMSRKEIWIESRIFPIKGAKFQMTGPLAQSVGAKNLEVEVIRTEVTHLTYRFSMALVCSWKTNLDESKTEETLQNIVDIGTTQPIKAFLAVQSPALRGSLIRHLEDSPFETRTALKKQSMVDEPRYFCPHLVIIEDRLTNDQGNYERFSAMMESLSDDVTVLVIGEEDILNTLIPLSHGRKLKTIKRIPVNFREYIIQQVLPPNFITNLPHSEASFIPKDHEFSLAELKFPAILWLLHPGVATMALPHPVGVYGLARIESPLLEKIVSRYPYSKIARSFSDSQFEDKGFPYLMECFFCDVSQSKRHDLAKALGRVFERGLQEGSISDEDFLLNFEASVVQDSAQDKSEPDPSDEEAYHEEPCASETMQTAEAPLRVSTLERIKSGEPVFSARFVMVLVFTVAATVAALVTSAFIYAKREESTRKSSTMESAKP